MRMTKKPLALAIGAAFALTGVAAHASVFQATDLGAGYMVASAGDAKNAEGKCGADKKAHDKKADGKCGEGKCGEGKCGADKKAHDKKADGKCGEKK